MRRTVIFTFVLFMLGILLVGCTDPKSSAGETSAEIPSLNEPDKSDQATAAPSGSSDISETSTGATTDETPPEAPDTAPDSSDSEDEVYEPGELTPDPDPTIDIGEGSVELVGGD